MPNSKVLRFHQDHAKRCDPKDFWGQVQRTVGGKPVAEAQIGMMVDAILSGLDLRPHDFVLDLCCGNGALSDRVFQQCRGGLGVDFSDYLIEVARHNFEKPPERTYILRDVAEFAASTVDTRRFSKALCYGAFQYLAPEKSAGLLTDLRSRFPQIRTVFVGNLPDRTEMHAFADIENGHDGRFGVWRTEREFAELAAAAGWQATIRRMPAAYHAAYYRYDAILTPGGEI